MIRIMNIRIIKLILAASLSLIVPLFLISCISGTETTASPDETLLSPDALSPGQIDESMLDSFVKVQGKVLALMENPGGSGGVFIKLGDSKGEVGFRIEQEDWESYTDEKKEEFGEGNTIIAEGMLVLSGQELVIVYMKPPLAAEGDQPSSTDYVFTVTVPENTVLTTAVGLLLFDENNNRLGTLEMEQVDPFTWRCFVPAGIKTLGYRYFRDGWDWEAAEEFTPDSKDTLRWVHNLTPGQEINDTVTKWRWYPEPDYEMPVVESNASITDIVPRINGEQMQRGYGFVDFWWCFFPLQVHGTNMAMMEANANWIKLMPAAGFKRVEPLPEMNIEEVDAQGYPVYGPGELENHIAQAKKDGLEVLLVPQCGTFLQHRPDMPPDDPEFTLNGDKQYSDEWWEVFLKEMEQYGTHYARLAEECGIEYMVMQDTYMWNSSKAPANIQEKYAEYIDNIRNHYSGKLGMAYNLDTYKTPYDLYPTGYFPEEFDFLAVGGPGAIASNRDSSVEEMEANFKKMVDGALKTLYDKYHKPIILYSYGVPSVDGGASGDFFFDDDRYQQWSEYDEYYKLDLAEQALACEAVMRVVAQTPYITGFYTFDSHWPSPFPLSLSYDMWGKPAIDQVLSEWYLRFKEEGK